MRLDSHKPDFKQYIRISRILCNVWKRLLKHEYFVFADTPKPQHKGILKQTPNKSKTESKSVKLTSVKTPTPFKAMDKSVGRMQKTVKIEPKATDNKNMQMDPFDALKMGEQDEIIDEEEFLEDDNFELDEEVSVRPQENTIAISHMTKMYNAI